MDMQQRRQQQQQQQEQQQQQLVKGKKSRKSSENTRMTKKSFKKVEAMKVVYISTPMKVTTSASKFRAIVQELTGRESDVVSIMETSGGNDSWMVHEDHIHIDSGCKAAEVTTMTYANNTHNERSSSSLPVAVDNNTNGSSPSVSSSEEFDGVFVKGQDSNFGLFDHTSFFYDQLFHQLDVLGGY